VALASRKEKTMKSMRSKTRLERHGVSGITPLIVIGVAELVLAGCGSSGSSSTSNPPGNAPVFANSTAITNPYFPLAGLNQGILEGTEDGESVRVELTRKPGTKSFTVNGQTVTALILEEREFTDGELVEVSLNYFGQASDGTVYYFGEDVDDYEDGQIVGHDGAWLFGVHTQQLGVIMPGNPKIGDTFKPESVPGITEEDAEVVSLSETVTVPAGTFTNCLKVKETHDGQIEYKYYAPGVGLVREADEGDQPKLSLQSRQ
jgi:hypothetical protein